MNTRLPLLVALVVLPLRSFAADLPVSYLVEEKPLKAAIAGTSLSFELYSDNTCTTLVQSVAVNVENVTVLSKLKQMTPKGDTKLPNTVEIRTTLAGVDSNGPVSLKVVGVGVVPTASACQVQAATTGTPVVVAANGKIFGVPMTVELAGGRPAIVKRLGSYTFALVRFDTATQLYGTHALRFLSSDCSGAPYLPREGRVYPDSTNPESFGAPPTGRLGSAIYVVGGAYSSQSFGSYFDVDGDSCSTTSGTEDLAPAIQVEDLSNYPPPYSTELR